MSDLNPYQSPAAETGAKSSSRFRMPRVLFFLVNFAITILFFSACVMVLAEPKSPFAGIGALIGILPLLVYGICEWVAFVHQNRSVERRLGSANLGCAGFVAFGVVTNVGEAMMKQGFRDLALLTWIALIGGAMVAYLVASGRYRLRERTVYPRDPPAP